MSTETTNATIYPDTTSYMDENINADTPATIDTGNLYATPAPSAPVIPSNYVSSIPGRTDDGNLLSKYFPFYDKSWSAENIKNDLDALKTFYESKTPQIKVIAVVEDENDNVNIYYNACETFVESTTTPTSTSTYIPE